MNNEDTNLSFYLRSNAIHIFKDAIRVIGTPEFIRFRVHPDGTSMLMESYDRITLTSFRVPKNVDTGRSLVVHSKAFCRIMANRLGWDISESYRVPGRMIPSENVVIFDLTKAVPIREYRN